MLDATLAPPRSFLQGGRRIDRRSPGMMLKCRAVSHFRVQDIHADNAGHAGSICWRFGARMRVEPVKFSRN